MSYSNQSNDKQLPSVEYSLKSISWHLKIISESMNRLIEMQNAQLEHNRPSSQNFSNQNKADLPF